MAEKTVEIRLPHGLKAIFTIDDENPRQIAPDRDLIRAPHPEACKCGKCPNKKAA